MKKLHGMKGFSSLENKKLRAMNQIRGGAPTQTKDRWTDATCVNNIPDTKCWLDGHEVPC
ncbi:grasp-with-spasm system A modified peptide [Chryseobacterium koreense]